MTCVLLFFFSSRRRHTRFSRDWSSDVCSSDLDPATATCSPAVEPPGRAQRVRETVARVRAGEATALPHGRSEERRVGKEWRSRGAAEHRSERMPERRWRKDGTWKHQESGSELE